MAETLEKVAEKIIGEKQLRELSPIEFEKVLERTYDKENKHIVNEEQHRALHSMFIFDGSFAIREDKILKSLEYPELWNSIVFGTAVRKFEFIEHAMLPKLRSVIYGMKTLMSSEKTYDFIKNLLKSQVIKHVSIMQLYSLTYACIEYVKSNECGFHKTLKDSRLLTLEEIIIKIASHQNFRKNNRSMIFTHMIRLGIIPENRLVDILTKNALFVEKS